jgi:uncharacterized protein YjbI with pentapeptide repeats
MRTRLTPSEVLKHLASEVQKNSKVSFRALVGLAGLSPERDFVGASLKGLDFRDEDLRGFNFCNADLTGADFRRADISGARFDGAILLGAIGLKNATTLPFEGAVTLPPPDFDISKVKELILHGRDVPERWMPFVTDLDFSFESNFNLEPLAKLMNLQALDFTGVPIQDLEPLKGLTNLRDLRLGDTNVENIDALASMVHLNTLDLTNTKVKDITVLGKMPNLTALLLIRSQVTNLGAVRHSHGLTIVAAGFQFGQPNNQRQARGGSMSYSAA